MTNRYQKIIPFSHLDPSASVDSCLESAQGSDGAMKKRGFYSSTMAYAPVEDQPRTRPTVRISELSDDEFDLMMLIWRNAGSSRISYGNLLILLSRAGFSIALVKSIYLPSLVVCGFLENGRTKIGSWYRAKISYEQFILQMFMQSLSLHRDATFTELIAALYQSDAISRHDLNELRHWLSTLEECER